MIVKPGAREEKVVQAGEGYVVVYIQAPPVENRANEAVVRLLARHYGVPRAQVRIITGRKGRRKLVEIDVERGEKS
ncbi:MAG: DUF167 domain-containing protein [Armatimonadota bacterium]|nr:DUF167 domain-containing protein [Armatimonadota bacterium]MDR5703936.1 DUF167 domain-containing protein [Armatimonadota bacterium]